LSDASATGTGSHTLPIVKKVRVVAAIEKAASSKKKGTVTSRQRSNESSIDEDREAKRFEVLKSWQLLTASKGKKQDRKNESKSYTDSILNVEQIAEKRQMVHESTSLFGSMICHPDCAGRIFWDIMSLALVIYDMITIPLYFLDLPSYVFMTAMAWTTRLFWTLDVSANFMTGFVAPDGEIDLRPPMIARRYLKTWFGIDFVLILVDYLELLWSKAGGLGYARIAKSSRVFRIIRMIRLLRVFKLHTSMKALLERIKLHRVAIVSDIAKIVAIIMGCAHVIACCWYGLGNSRGPSWMMMIDPHIDRNDVAYLYTVALHWSLSQFGGGMDEVRPQCMNERVFAICIFLMAFVTASVFVSNLTSSMTRLHMLSNYQSKQTSVLKRYLTDHSVSNGLHVRILRNAQHALWLQGRYVPEENVELLKLVSKPLRIELHYEQYSPYILRHPFFKKYTEECPHVIRKVVHSAVGTHRVYAGDVLFHEGEIPPRPMMYFILSGSLRYISSSGLCTHVLSESWVSEAPLWTQWMHRGTLAAENECHVCVLDVGLFQEVCGQFDHPRFNPSWYASEYVNTLNDHTDNVSDLQLNSVDSHADVPTESDLVLKAQQAEHNTTRHTIVQERKSVIGRMFYNSDSDGGFGHGGPGRRKSMSSGLASRMSCAGVSFKGRMSVIGGGLGRMSPKNRGRDQVEPAFAGILEE
jgi:hypothetical protein